MAEPMPWLAQAGPGDVESALGRLLEKWLAEWIVQPPKLRLVARVKAEIKVTQWHGVPGALLGSTTDAQALLGRAVCGGEGDVAHHADRDILQKVGAEIVDEFALKFASLGGGGSGITAAPCHTPGDDALFLVSSGAGGWSLSLALAPATLVAVRKTVANTRRRLALGTRRAALAPLTARLGCHLGQARLSAGEVSQLAIGDVVVFDQQHGGPLALTVAGHICAKGTAVIKRSAQGASITIAERASLKRKVG